MKGGGTDVTGRNMFFWVVPVDAARRKFLVAFGFTYLAIGFAYTFADENAPIVRALGWIPVPFWLLGVMWVACGFISFASAFLPSTKDRLGFRSLAIPPTVWCFAWAVAWLLNFVPGGYFAPRALISVMVFGLLAYAVDVVSGMVDADLLKTVELPAEIIAHEGFPLNGDVQ